MTMRIVVSYHCQVSSNFERFLLDVVDGDCGRIRTMLEDLKTKKSFTVTDAELAKARREFGAFAVSEKGTVTLGQN